MNTRQGACQVWRHWCHRYLWKCQVQKTAVASWLDWWQSKEKWLLSERPALLDCRKKGCIFPIDPVWTIAWSKFRETLLKKVAWKVLPARSRVLKIGNNCWLERVSDMLRGLCERSQGKSLLNPPIHTVKSPQGTKAKTQQKLSGKLCPCPLLSLLLLFISGERVLVRGGWGVEVPGR